MTMLSSDDNSGSKFTATMISRIIDCNEEFIYGTYNGLTIIIRSKDKYINAGKLCRDNLKDFYGFKRGERFNEIVKYWNENCNINSEKAIYNISKGFKNDLRGVYIHQDLNHFVSEWVNIEYAFKVKNIMDSINKIGQLTINQNYSDDHLQEMKNRIMELEEQNKDKDEIIQTQDSTINQLMNQTIELQFDKMRNLLGELM